MSRRALFILGCGLLLGGGLLVIYLLQQLHPYDKLVNHGPSPEARANPYLAAELFLRQQKLEVQRPDGSVCDAGEIGELMLWRGGGWMSTKDRAKTDEDGYFYHCGRADDVIISAGWTMSAVEIENTMLKHDAVLECGVIGVPDEKRGQVVKAFVVSNQSYSEALVKELQEFTREKLAQHEFPRIVEFVAELPKTPAGKVHRKMLRDQEAAKASA